MTNFFKYSFLVASAMALSACVGNAPSPETDPQAAQVPATETSEPASSTATSTVDETAIAPVEKQEPVSAESNGKVTEVPATTPTEVTSSVPTPEAPTGTAEGTAAAPVDPYTEIPALIENIFAYADTLYKAGYVDSATAYLERFRVIKPLWDQWQTKADSMLNDFGKTRAEKAKAYEPMVFQIQNMNRANAAYSMVAETADSLIALAPGDSLTQWAKSQKDVAYKNTLAKAKKEYATIKALADDQARFTEAEKQAVTLQMRYRDFEDALKLQELIDYIRGLSATADETAAKYWEKNDPAKALAQADSLIQKEKFGAAKEILNKLKASKLRKEANERYTKLSDTYCTKQRKATSQIFAKAQKQKNADKKKKLLQDAIAPLDKCLTEYPENPQKQKVLENKKFLENELAK